MATIIRVRRTSGYAFKACIRLRGIKPFSKTFRLKTDAKAWAERMERNIDEARAHGNDSARTLTLRELVRAFKRQYGGRNHSALFCLAWWVRELGDMKLADISRNTIRDALRRLECREVHRRDGRRKIITTTKTRAPATLNRYKSALSAVFEYGRETFDLQENPCRQVKALAEDNRRIRFLSEDERKKLLLACRASNWGGLFLLVLMAITTGARLGELLRLRWHDINTTECDRELGENDGQLGAMATKSFFFVGQVGK